MKTMSTSIYLNTPKSVATYQLRSPWKNVEPSKVAVQKILGFWSCKSCRFITHQETFSWEKILSWISKVHSCLNSYCFQRDLRVSHWPCMSRENWQVLYYFLPHCRQDFCTNEFTEFGHLRGMRFQRSAQPFGMPRLHELMQFAKASSHSAGTLEDWGCSYFKWAVFKTINIPQPHFRSWMITIPNLLDSITV